jgi:hypothetical protein
MKKSRGRTLKLYLVDGTPTGVITAELGVSSVRAVMSSRTALPDLIKREEASRTGVYLLIGPDPDFESRQLVYVGEGDNVGQRLARHDGDVSKDFFTRAVLIVSKDENLTKAHGRYLESRIISLINTAGRAKLANQIEPNFKGLPEPEIADMERVLDEIETLLPVLGFDILRPAGQKLELNNGLEKDGSPQDTDDILFSYVPSGAQAWARESAGEFIVLKGSFAKKQEVPSCNDGLKRSRATLIERGVLIATGDNSFFEFSKDYPFNSPSGAAAVIYGGQVSGNRYWKHDKTGQTYGDWRKARLNIQDD